MLVAAAAGAAAHDNGDNAAAACLDGCHQIEAGGADITRLDAIDALDAAKQPVVIAVSATFVGKGAGREIIVVTAMMLAQRDAEPGHVASGGILTGIGQAVRVAEN